MRLNGTELIGSSWQRGGNLVNACPLYGSVIMSVAWNLPAENQSGEFRSSSTHPTHLSGTGRSGNVATLQRALYQIKHVGATRSISVEYEVVISG